MAFEEQLSTIREILAEIYQEEEDWSLAARTLQGIPLDSGHRAISDEYKLKIYIQIVALFLEGGFKRFLQGWRRERVGERTEK